MNGLHAWGAKRVRTRCMCKAWNGKNVPFRHGTYNGRLLIAWWGVADWVDAVRSEFQVNWRLLVYYLLTYSMVQSPSWEANRFAASQETPRISRNPKVHYRTHKRPSPVSILGRPNRIHIPTSHLLEIHPNIIHSSTPTCVLGTQYIYVNTINKYRYRSALRYTKANTDSQRYLRKQSEIIVR